MLFEHFFGICCDNLNYISENIISIRRQKIFLDNFFNNLLIWGAQGEEIYPNEEVFEFYSYKGLKLIKEACDILDKNNYDENLINSKNNKILTRKLFLINSLRIYFKQILSVMQNLDIDTSLNNNINNSRDTLRISNLDNNKINNKEKLILNEDEEDGISSCNTNSNIINTKIEFNNDLIDDSKNKNIKENNFYQKLNDISGNFKIFKTSVGHNGSLSIDEQNQFFFLLIKSGIIN